MTAAVDVDVAAMRRSTDANDPLWCSEPAGVARRALRPLIPVQLGFRLLA
jgi:hypothetical protein